MQQAITTQKLHYKLLLFTHLCPQSCEYNCTLTYNMKSLPWLMSRDLLMQPPTERENNFYGFNLNSNMVTLFPGE